MWKQYIKQALYQLKENRLISIVCMVGTALAICMIKRCRNGKTRIQYLNIISPLQL